MTTLYFDSSAFVKLLVNEDGSDLAEVLWDACDVAVASRLAFVEVFAALSAAGRNGRVSRSRSNHASDEWRSLWDDVQAVELSPSVALSAGACAQRYDLSGADAVHLASALALREAPVVFVSWDRRLAMAALAAGLAVAPAPTLANP